MEQKVDWLKISGLVCTVAGAVLSIVSSVIDQKTTEAEIAKQVEEQVKRYMENGRIM
jgi:hypothetical protein